MLLRKKWSKESMLMAITAVKTSKMGYKKASKTFNVPRTTLMNYVKRSTKTYENILSIPLGRKPVLGILEDNLVKYCKEINVHFNGLRKRDICVLAYELAVKYKLKNSFIKTKGIAGRKWLQGFLRRNPNLAFHNHKKNSVETITRENVNAFFDLLKQELRRINFNAHKIFSVYEIGVTIARNTKSKVICVKGKKEVGKLSPVEKATLITIVTCMSASGVYIPPFLVFPEAEMKVELLDGTPHRTVATSHPSGWIQPVMFTDWLNHFIQFGKATPEDPVVLILDGHYSHVRSMSVIDLAWQNGVTIICLPPFSTHKLHPVEVEFMASFKRAYSNEIETWLDTHPSQVLSVYEVGKLFGNAYLSVATVKNALQGFRKCGIHPFDRSQVNPAEFIFECSASDRANCSPSTSSACSM